jgi:hypothetical protein
MSRKGTCWDNACSETLFGPMKVERLHGTEFHNPREAKDSTLEWLLWHNGSRMRSKLRYLSPARLEQQASPHHSPSQSDREGSTATRRKSKTSKPMSDAF